MTRISVGDGFWFDDDKAEKFEEATYHDGSNFISVATGGQWAHEVLYRTSKGKWVLNSWSQWQGSRDHYIRIGAPEAREWLLVNDHGSTLDKYFPVELAAAEL